jgi:hypothetical protein
MLRRPIHIHFGMCDLSMGTRDGSSGVKDRRRLITQRCASSTDCLYTPSAQQHTARFSRINDNTNSTTLNTLPVCCCVSLLHCLHLEVWMCMNVYNTTVSIVSCVVKVTVNVELNQVIMMNLLLPLLLSILWLSGDCCASVCIVDNTVNFFNSAER